jgi:hypothetical protein
VRSFVKIIDIGKTKIKTDDGSSWNVRGHIRWGSGSSWHAERIEPDCEELRNKYERQNLFRDINKLKETFNNAKFSNVTTDELKLIIGYFKNIQGLIK